jgi:hypothetical protein
MTVLTQPRPGDTGEIRTGGDRTRAIRVPADLRPSQRDADGETRRIKPPTLLLKTVPRRPPVNPTEPGRLIEPPAGLATGAELTVAARGGFTTSPTAPPRPLPTPKPRPTKDMGAGYTGRHRAASTDDVEVAVEPVAEIQPARVWPNRIPRLLDFITGRNVRGAR